MNQLSVAEIVRKVRKIKLVANRSASDLLAGQYRSVFRGQGMEFDEVREYQPGDEIRAIDWNVTARTGSPFIKRFVEEREMTVLLAMDISASGLFGSMQQSKLEVMIELMAVLMFSAVKNNDKLGLVLFTDQVLHYFPPRKGKSNALRLIREMLSTEARSTPANLESALQFIYRVQKRRAVVFLVSDFQDDLPVRQFVLNRRKHDLVAISIRDPREEQLPNVGWINLRDPETGKTQLVDTANRDVRNWFQQQSAARRARLSSWFSRAGVDHLEIDTHQSYTENLHKFFEKRERRK